VNEEDLGISRCMGEKSRALFCPVSSRPTYPCTQVLLESGDRTFPRTKEDQLAIAIDSQAWDPVPSAGMSGAGVPI